MSMTREEAFKKYEEWRNLGFGHSTMPSSEVLVMAMNSLRPITREQVEKVCGEWIVQQDEHKEYIKKCSKCGFPISGWWGADKFCANCGEAFTDEAVDMVMYQNVEKLKKRYPDGFDAGRSIHREG